MTLHLVPDPEGHSSRVEPRSPKTSVELYRLAAEANAELLHGVTSGDVNVQVGALRRLLAIGCLAQMAADELEGSR